MTLNVKLSLAICLGFIVSMTWLLGQVSRPVETIPSPLVARATAWGDWIIPPMVDERPAEVFYASDDALAEPSFAHPSARERSAQAALAATPPPDTSRAARAAAQSTTMLPPVVASATPPATTPTAATTEPEPPAPAEPRPAPAVLAARSSAPQTTDYVIQSGDTLIAIAGEFFDTTASDDEVALILAANPHLGGDPDRIHAGQTIEIPVPSRPLARSSARDDSAGGRVATAAAVEAPREEDSGPHYYTVRKNDSLSRIARRLLGDESRWKEIKRLNGIEQSSRIYPGMVIKLPEAPVFAGGPNMRT